MATVTNYDLIRGLRAIADTIEKNPGVNFATGDDEQVLLQFRSWYMHGESKDAQRKHIADIVRAFGDCEKIWGDSFLWLKKDIAAGVRVEISAERETVCERVVTGHITVAAKPERIIPAEPEREIEQVEWRCHPILESVAERNKVIPSSDMA